MSAHWNSSYTTNHISTERSRPHVSNPTMLACRICDHIFLNTNSLIQHYESHEREIGQRNQNHQTTPYPSSLRMVRERNLTNNSFQPRQANPSNLQQRHHPYLPNGYRMLQCARVSIPETRPFLASTHTPHFIQPRRLVANNNALGVAFQLPNQISGRNVAHGSPFDIHQRSPAQQVAPPQRVMFSKFREQNGQIEPEDKRTVWYLSQLEKPMPKIIDLDRNNELHEFLQLDLTLKL